MSPFHLHLSGTPGRPRILWLHGFLGDGSDGTALLAPLADRFEICAPDLPGHGNTPPAPRSETLRHIAGLAAGCALAAGYSMGGRLLMMAAARHPESTPPLLLESAHLGYADPAERAARRALDADRAATLRRIGLAAFLKEWYRLPLWATLPAPPERRGDPETLAAALETFSTGNQPDLRPWLRHCPRPVLWLAGGEDPAYKEQALWVAARVPRATVRILPGCGHNLHLEQPALWRECLLEFQSAPSQHEQ